MNRIDFISEKPKVAGVFPHEALSQGNIRIYLNDKLQPGVNDFKLHMDLTYGYFRVSLKRFKLDTQYTHNQNRPMYVVNDQHEIVTEEINPGLEKDALILERIEEDGKIYKFYLRTILNHEER